MHVRIPAALGGDCLLQNTAVNGGSGGARGTLTRVDADDSDITKQGDSPAGPDTARPRCCNNVHTTLIIRSRADMCVPEKAFRSNSVTSFTKDLSPRLRGGGMPAMDAACACASRSVMSKRIEWSATALPLTRFNFSKNGETKPATEQALMNRIT